MDGDGPPIRMPNEVISAHSSPEVMVGAARGLICSSGPQRDPRRAIPGPEGQIGAAQVALRLQRATSARLSRRRPGFS